MLDSMVLPQSALIYRSRSALSRLCQSQHPSAPVRRSLFKTSICLLFILSFSNQRPLLYFISRVHPAAFFFFFSSCAFNPDFPDLFSLTIP